jgi:hypothetical protein
MSLLAPDAAAPKFVRAPAAVVAPVPPFATDSAVLRVSALKVGELVVLMSWTVLTAPAVTVKFAELNEAIPLAVVDASSIVMVVPAPVELLIVSEPVRPLTELTPAPLTPQVGQLMLPLASRTIGPLALTANVPLAFGRV